MALKPWEFDNPACIDAGTELFYMEDDEFFVNTQSKGVAKKICNSCVHRSDCAEWGIANEIFGIWGGLTSEERNRLRRRMRIRISDGIGSYK
jgi:WhiB family redox-sensing transcriptional regulator